MTRSVYRLIDCKGRVYIPKDMRQSLEVDYGDIVKLAVVQGNIQLQKVHLIEVGDKSTEATEAYVKAAILQMPPHKRLEMAIALLGKESSNES